MGNEVLIAVVGTLIAAIPTLISVLNKRKKERGETDEAQAAANKLFAQTATALLAPQNQRIAELERDFKRERRINRLANQVIRLKGDFIAILLTAIKALGKQLEQADITPTYVLNGEYAEYRTKVEQAKAKLEEAETACDDRTPGLPANQDGVDEGTD